MLTNFADRLDAALIAAGNPCLIGIDPHLDLLPEEFAVARREDAPRAERAGAMTAFCRELIDLVAGRVPAVKPQSAFFEQLGADGALAWENVVTCARAAGLIVIGDVKRGDIASTATAYGRALLGTAESSATHLCDAITVNPYLGPDSIEPLAEIAGETGRGLFVLVRTSNPGSGSFQLYGEPHLWREVARSVEEIGSAHRGTGGLSAIGAVVGATHPKELADLRAALPNTPLLLPGYGAQGGAAADLAPAFLERGRGALVNSSRGIAFAYRNDPGRHWKDAAAAALDHMIEEISAVAGS